MAEQKYFPNTSSEPWRFADSTPVSDEEVRARGGSGCSAPRPIGLGHRHWSRCEITARVACTRDANAGNLDAQRVDGGVRATKQRPQVRPTEREVDGLLRPPDDADAPALRCDDPDAARPSAINPPDAVDLEAVGDARLAALVAVGEDAVPDHIPGRVEPIAWVYCEERVFATYIVRSSSDS